VIVQLNFKQQLKHLPVDAYVLFCYSTNGKLCLFVFQNGLDGPLPTALNRRQQQPQTALEQRGIFMQEAKKIGYHLSQTFMKLEQLSLIAKQSSLFNDKSMEIQDLTLAIKQDISHMNQQIGQLQQV